MVGNLAGEKPVPEVLLSEIVSKIDGVPLYVEELTKAVLESGCCTKPAMLTFLTAHCSISHCQRHYMTS